jgi:L-serine/L-threonine ammonia-lyase
MLCRWGRIIGRHNERLRPSWLDRRFPFPKITSYPQLIVTNFLLIVPIVALETDGSNVFYQSYLLNKINIPVESEVSVVLDIEHNISLAKLPRIASRAGSLGATSPSAQCVKMALQRSGPVTCVSVPDELSMIAALSFASRSPRVIGANSAGLKKFSIDDHQIMAEMSCSTTLVAAYVPGLLRHHILRGEAENIVFIYCGGSKISVDDLAEYHTIVESLIETDVRVQGKRITVQL